MIFPNQTEFGLKFSGHWQWSSKFSKPIWIWFGICVLQNQFFLSKPNSNWFGKSYAFLGFNFSNPNWIWFGKGNWIKCSCRFPPVPLSHLLWKGNSSWLTIKTTDCLHPGWRQRATTPNMPSTWILVTFRDSCEKCWSIVRLRLEWNSEPCGVVGSITRSLKRWS